MIETNWRSLDGTQRPVSSLPWHPVPWATSL